jgi:DNA processing protein
MDPLFCDDREKLPPAVETGDLPYWIGLNMVVGIGKTLFHRLLRHFGSPRRVFSAARRELLAVDGIGEKTAGEILQFDVVKSIEKELRYVEKLGAKAITLGSPDYPSLLKAIYDPPPVLYYMGTSPARYAATIAVVGTRQPTEYGRMVAERLAAGLAERGVCIVSGMARGIDTVSHQSALKAGGATLAVFGNGLAHTYPPDNAGLRKRIVANGAVISEFPMTMKPDRNNFPARNRVISGLSFGTVIVEAGDRSGALITADFALEQGREVFAVPGNINSAQSVGANRLLRMGAKLVDGVEAVVEELAPAVRALLKTPVAQSDDTVVLSPREKILMGLLAEGEKHIDFLIERSGLAPGQASSALVQLELKGKIRQADGKTFIVTGM